MAGVTVDPLLVGDAPAAGGLLAASRGEYPAFRRLLLDPAVRARVLRPFMCHIHTSDQANLAYYGRWGFELTQPAIHAGADGPTYYGMTRPPARPGDEFERL